MSHNQHFRVWRGDAGGGELADFHVAVHEGEVVLDVIHRLQATQAPDLAVRWNCKAGKCGSCSAEVNGRPRLMCMTRMSTFSPGEVITVTPMRTFPVIRDLVTDVSFNYVKARSVPAFHPPAGLAPGEFRMAQADVERSQEFRKCIECYLCQNTCHVIRDHEENKPAFSGPRLFIRVAELDMHPLDTLDRKRAAQDAHGLGFCNITKCCTEVCPEGIHITDNAIIPMKERVVDVKWDPWMRWVRRLPSGEGRSAARSLRQGDAAAAATTAQVRLERAPSDLAALRTLVRAHLAQGEWVVAAATARRGASASGERSATHMVFQADRAWALLCAAEAGVSEYDEVEDEASGALDAAQRLASSGTVFARVHGLKAYLDGHYDTAIGEAGEILAWDRSPTERADAWLTIATSRAALGHEGAAREALGRATALDQDNPRLPAVVRRLEGHGVAAGPPSPTAS